MLPSIAKVLSPERQKLHIPQKGTLFQQCMEVHGLWNPLGDEFLVVSSKYRLERGTSQGWFLCSFQVRKASEACWKLQVYGEGAVALCPCLDLPSISAWCLRQDTEPDAPVAIIRCFMRALLSYIAAVWSIRQYPWPHCSTEDLGEHC